MASLPGMPGSLGLPGGSGLQQSSGNPSGSDLSLDIPSDSGSISSAAIVNRTVFHSPVIPRPLPSGPLVLNNGSVSIPPTTAGNTLVIVQMSTWWTSIPVFNGVAAGYPADYFGQTPINTPDNGFDGDGSDFVYPNSLNTGAEIAYFTNIAGGVTEISYPTDFPLVPSGTRNCGFIPTIGIVYELLPCSVVSIFGTADDTPVAETSAPDLQAYAVTGPVSGGIYISCLVTYSGDPMSGAFSGVNSPWELEYQETINEPSGRLFLGAATALIVGGGGPQQAIFTWGGPDPNPYYGATSIALFCSALAGPPTSGGDVNQFLPNVWIVS
jgi:hypothetical protein